MRSPIPNIPYGMSTQSALANQQRAARPPGRPPAHLPRAHPCFRCLAPCAVGLLSQTSQAWRLLSPPRERSLHAAAPGWRPERLARLQNPFGYGAHCTRSSGSEARDSEHGGDAEDLGCLCGPETPGMVRDTSILESLLDTSGPLFARLLLRDDRHVESALPAHDTVCDIRARCVEGPGERGAASRACQPGSTMGEYEYNARGESDEAERPMVTGLRAHSKVDDGPCRNRDGEQRERGESNLPSANESDPVFARCRLGVSGISHVHPRAGL